VRGMRQQAWRSLAGKQQVDPMKPLSLRERGWGEGAASARWQRLVQDVSFPLRPNPHPPLGTLSRRERDSLRKLFGTPPPTYVLPLPHPPATEKL
jgi:hypothetical protein